APERPTTATLIAAVPTPSPVPAQDYSYTDCNNPYGWQYCQEYYDYAPYSYYGYSFPYYAYSIPVGFGFRFFHHHAFHPVFHRFFHGWGFHRGFPGGFHGGFPRGRFHAGFRGGVSMAAVVVTAGIADALIGLPIALTPGCRAGARAAPHFQR